MSETKKKWPGRSLANFGAVQNLIDLDAESDDNLHTQPPPISTPLKTLKREKPDGVPVKSENPSSPPAAAWEQEVASVTVPSGSAEGATEEAALQIQSILQANVHSDKLLMVSKPSDDASGIGDDDACPSPLEIECKQAVETGKFPTRNSMLARKWNEEIADKTSQLAKEYAKLPKLYATQRQFKTKWAEKSWSEATALRRAISTSSSVEKLEGRYLSFNQVVKEEGGGRLGLEAGKNYLLEARRMASLGRTLRGRPYVAYNAWTKMVQMLYTSTGFPEEHAETKSLERVQTLAQTPARGRNPCQETESDVERCQRCRVGG